MENVLIIVNYNDPSGTAALARTASLSQDIAEVIIVDSRSTDRSCAVLEGICSERITLIRSEENLGYSHAVNLGAYYALGKYGSCAIAVSNSDIELEPSLFGPLFSHLGGDTVIAAPVIRQGDGVSRGWKIPTPADDVFMSIPVYFRHYEKKHLQYPDEHYTGRLSFVDAVSGCFFAVSGDFFRSVGGMDENVFLYYEENILGMKAREKGVKIAVVNGLSVMHHHSESVDRSINRLRKHGTLKKSRLYFHRVYSKASPRMMRLLNAAGNAASAVYALSGAACRGRKAVPEEPRTPTGETE